MPELKVGTLDSLMSLSDDLERVDRYVEGVVHRLEKEIRNIINSDADEHENPAKRESREKQIREMKFIETGATNERMPPTYIAAEQYLKKFQWDQTRCVFSFCVCLCVSACLHSRNVSELSVSLLHPPRPSFSRAVALA